MVLAAHYEYRLSAILNPYYGPDAPWEPQYMPATPNPSMAMEAFMDTPMVNGAAYPYLEVEPKAYRFRILNAADDRFFNLQLYVADPNVTTQDGRNNTEVKMVPASACIPACRPTGRPMAEKAVCLTRPQRDRRSSRSEQKAASCRLRWCCQTSRSTGTIDQTNFDFGNVNQGTLDPGSGRTGGCHR